MLEEEYVRNRKASLILCWFEVMNPFFSVHAAGSSKAANEIQELYEFDPLNTVTSDHVELFTIYIKNFTGLEVSITDRSNIGKRFSAPRAHERSTHLEIEVRKRLIGEEIDRFKRLADSVMIDPILAEQIRGLATIKYNPAHLISGGVTVIRKFLIPRHILRESPDGLYLEEYDLFIFSGEADKMPPHPKSDAGLRHSSTRTTWETMQTDRSNVASIVILTPDERLKVMYRAHLDGISVLQTWHRSDFTDVKVLVTQPKVYSSESTRSVPDEVEMETIVMTLAEATERFHICRTGAEARELSARMKRQSGLADVIKAETEVLRAEMDVKKELVKRDAVEHDRINLRNERDYDQHSAYNKGAVETIKTIGLIGAGIGALIGLVKLLKG